MSASENTESNQELSGQAESLSFRLPGYEILAKIAEGGMSVVYKARSQTLDRIVAIKVLRQDLTCDNKALKRFSDESKLLSSLKHPQIVEIFSVGHYEQAGSLRPYIVMEFIDGITLAQFFKEKGAFDAELFEAVFIPTMEAISFAHESKVLHRDLKPQNLMISLDESGKPGKVKILDFGLAKALADNQQSLASTLAMQGSPLYMSPEQCGGKAIDARSDLYSLACIMYEALVGSPPYSGETALETMYEHMRKSIPKLKEIKESQNISKELVAAISKALAKDPEDRHENMQAFLFEVKSALCSGTFLAAGKMSLPVLLSLVLLFASFSLWTIFLVNEQIQQNRNLNLKQLQQEQMTKKERLSSSSKEAFEKELQRAAELRSQGRYAEGLAVCRKLLAEEKKRASPRKKLLDMAYLEESAFYDAQKDYKMEADCFKKAMELYSVQDSLQRYISHGRSLAHTYRESGEYKLAIDLVNKLKLDFEQVHGKDSSDFDHAALCYSLALFYYETANYQEAYANAKQGLSIFDRNGMGRAANLDPVDLSWYMYLAGKHCGKSDEGRKELERTKRELLQSGRRDACEAICKYAEAALGQNQKEEAEFMFQEALRRATLSSSKTARKVQEDCLKKLKVLGKR